MASQYALPSSDQRKKREEAARRANLRPGQPIEIPPVPDPVGLPKEMVDEGAVIAFESMGFSRPRAEQLAKVWSSVASWVPGYDKGMTAAEELSMTPEQRLASIGAEDVSPTDVNVKQPDTTPNAAVIIGQNAVKAPTLFLKPAQEDLNAGKSIGEVWKQWGWEPDQQGNLVSEISDRPAEVVTTGKDTTLGEGVKHPELFENYPERLPDVQYRADERSPFRQVSPNAGYTRSEHMPDPAAAPEGAIDAETPELDPRHPDSARGLTIHEVQHKVDELEDRPRGSSPTELGNYQLGKDMQKRAKKELAAAKKSGEQMDPERRRYLQELANATDDKLAHYAYEAHIGEENANNATRRMDMPPEQRASTPPSATERIPRDYQILKTQKQPFRTAKEGDPVSQEMADRDKLRGELASIAAPAVQTRGNEAMIEEIYKHAAENKPEDIYTPATNPVFDTSGDPAATTKEMVPQISKQESDLTPNIPGREGYPRGGRIQQIVENQEAIAQRIVSDLQRSGLVLPFYGTAPVLQTLIDQGVLSPGQAMLFMRDWAGQGAATSMRTETPQNLRNSSYLLFRRAQGDPLTPERQAEEAAGGRWGTYDIREKGKGIIQKPRLNRPGFQMLEEHTRRADEMANETIDAWMNSKPYMFREAWSGNMADVTADTHNIRSILSLYDQLFPGTLHRGWFKNDAAYNAYRDRGAFPPDFAIGGAQGPGVKLPDKTIMDTLPQPVIPGTGREGQIEYPLISNVTRRAGEIMGISPSEAQERMWFQYGPRTGLQSPPATIPMLLNSQIEATARALGVPPEQIMRLWGRRGIPLAQNEDTTMPGTSMVG